MLIHLGGEPRLTHTCLLKYSSKCISGSYDCIKNLRQLLTQNIH